MQGLSMKKKNNQDRSNEGKIFNGDLVVKMNQKVN